MAHKKGVGSSKNGRESESKRLGVKLFGGQVAKAGPPARYGAQPGRQCRHRQGPHALCADRRRSDVPQET